MTEPVVESITESTSVAGTPTVVTMPATRPDDDYYLMILARDDDDYLASIQDPAGWTRIDASLLGTDTIAYWWTIGSSLAPTVDIDITIAAAEQARMVVVRISGIDTTDPMGAIGTKTTGSSTTATAAAITAETADSLILRIYACTSSYFSSFASGTEVARLTSGTGGGICAYAVSSESSPGASTTTGSNTATVNDSGQSWYGNTIEILAAASGSTISDVNFSGTNRGVGRGIMRGVG